MTDRSSYPETKTRFRRNGHNGDTPITDTKEVVKKNGNGNGHKKNGNGKNGNGNGIVCNGNLRIKWARFIDEYLIDLNATQAAIRAGYSERSAQSTASLILSYPIIQEAIQKRRLELMEKTKWTPEKVLEGYKRLIDYSLEEIHNEDHSLLPVSQMSENVRFAVCGVKTKRHKMKKTDKDGKEFESESMEHELKFTPKKDIFDKVGEHLGMFINENGRGRGINVIGQNIQVNLTD